jgi:hypothetical protein
MVLVALVRLIRRERFTVVHTHSTKAVARNVVWLIDHPDEARQMGELARARAHALFRPAVMCELIEQTYQRLLGNPAPSSSPALRGFIGAASALDDSTRSPGVGPDQIPAQHATTCQ